MLMSAIKPTLYERAKGEKVLKVVQASDEDWTYRLEPYGGDSETARYWFIAASDEDGYDLGAIG